MTTRERQSRTDRKREEAQLELQEARREHSVAPQYERRRSVSAERVSEDELPPPSYEDVVHQDVRRA
jgi:hypothetical protein